jgi:gamma-F420-2:alpha-L-glutamate ligase
MRCWLIFHREVRPDVPEAPEIIRFQQAATRSGVELHILQPRHFDLVVGSSEGSSAIYQGRKLVKPDFIMARTGSETSYFTLAVLRHFEHEGIAMVNSPAAIEVVADKLQTLQVLSQAGLPIPKTILCKFPVDVNVVERELGFPVVVKTLRGTRGAGVLLCANREQFNDLASLLDGASAGTDFIFQQYVEASHGHDVRVLVVNGRAVAAMERRSTDGGFKSNISLGGVGTAFKPPREMAALAIRVTEALGLDVAGIDILFDRDGYRVCEANSAPGFQGLERACGISVPDEIFDAMRLRLGLGSAQPSISWGRSFIDAVRTMFVRRERRQVEPRT